MTQQTSCQNLNLMANAIYLQEKISRSFCVNAKNTILLMLGLHANYFPLLSKVESNASWKPFQLIYFSHGSNLCEFLDTFEDYDSTKLCNELQDHQRKNGEFLEDFAVRISHVLFKFHIIDLPSKSNRIILALNPYAPLVQQSQEACP